MKFLLLVSLFCFIAAFVSFSSCASSTVTWEVGSSDLVTHTAAVGDTLTFQYTSGHTVNIMADQTHFTNCDFTNDVPLNNPSTPQVGPVTYTFVQTDAGNTVYFACNVDSHCSLGLKLNVNVAAATTSTPAAASSTASNSGGGGGGNTAPISAGAGHTYQTLNIGCFLVAVLISLFSFLM